jgi:hypothetical protein
MIKKLTVILFLLAFANDAFAALTPRQIERAKAAHQVLSEVTPGPLNTILEKLEQSSFPEGNLQIMEAVAATYADMAREHDVVELPKKQWLHGMITLNMAYIQLGGEPSQPGDTGLNLLVRRKLMGRLSPGLLSDPRLIHSLE